MTPLRKPDIIYVLCPPKSVTGGPEALHQLGATLVRLGHQVYMVYNYGAAPEEAAPGEDAVRRLVFPSYNDPVADAYRKYDVPAPNVVYDTASNAVVVPEIWADRLSTFQAAQTYYWWLSLDYGLAAMEKAGGLAYLRSTRAVSLCQSAYALDHLEKSGVESLYPLSDYTFVPSVRGYENTAARKNVVLYNKKGEDFAVMIRDAAPHIEFQLLANLSREEVRQAFRTAKVYMDFGSHPGKDRMPREAVALGCYVIVGRRGAAANARDVPIPPHYKFPADPSSVDAVIRQLERILQGEPGVADDFAYYRRTILFEEPEFHLQARRIFGWNDIGT